MSDRIPIQNVYDLLCYAWDQLKEGELVAIGSESCDTLQDLLARVLINGTKRLIKRGLHRSYEEKMEETPSLRGRIAFAASLRQLSWTKGRMACEFTELSHETVLNRILKTTLRNLLYTNGISEQHKEEIGGLMHSLHEIRSIRLNSRIFRRIQYTQNLRFYRFMINVCELAYESLIPTENAGESKFRDFLQDRAKMPALFESFVRNFYRHETDFSVGRTQFPWAGFEGSEDTRRLLPTMNTDVELRRGDMLTILDCKYYLGAFTTNWNVERFHSSNMYQIVSYIKNRAIHNPELKISGMLLYPEVTKAFNHVFTLQGHTITVASINLNQSWTKISNDLKTLASNLNATPKTQN